MEKIVDNPPRATTASDRHSSYTRQLDIQTRYGTMWLLFLGPTWFNIFIVTILLIVTLCNGFINFHYLLSYFLWLEISH